MFERKMQSSKSSSVGSNEEFAEVLRSSWIRRLHLKEPTSSILKNKENPPSITPPIPVNSPPSDNQTTISTNESRTPSSIFNAPITPFPQPDKPSSKLDTIKCSFPGFGPFQLKNRATDSKKVTVLREDGDHLVDNCPENVNSKKMSSFSEKRLVNDRRGTPLSPFFQYWPDSKKKNTPIEEQTKFTEFGTSPNTSSISHPMCAPSLEALAGGESQNRRDEQCLAITRVSRDNQYCLRIGGVNCNENCDNGGASRILRDHQQNVVLSQLERNVSRNRNETVKASFWNMNRFRKAELLSSMLHPCRSRTKRKTPNPFDESACVKFRKLGHED
ncbi:hypothetical protein C5167_036023 [Papaver somniferum]|uniref:uncharacterized protein LOC113331213 n=1 Tax=Papaver somniferum TaxID=3469 RepID=UPI000E6F561D|nr:uncharacterized protein LOC113331213 [Papaver somniferum]RZC87479.1 hypothetical protein C5167_036023 [Papaver somniferum]